MSLFGIWNLERGIYNRDMTHGKFLAVIGFATAIAVTGWATVVRNIDPTQSGATGLILFYLTLFTSLVGALTLLGILFRVHVAKRRDVVLREVRVAFRHAILLSTTAVASLALAANRSFRWWSLPILLLIVGAAEYVFLNRDAARRL